MSTNHTPGDMVQIHLLTAYPAALLNRDDAGLAKRIPFGGTVRTRISSQCLKKHWRDAPGVSELGEMAHRSTRIYEQLIARPLAEEHGATEEEAASIARFLMATTVDTKEDKKNPLQSGQLLVLTRAETRFLADEGARILADLREQGVTATSPEDVKKNTKIDIKALSKHIVNLPASIDTALFGRMVTSDLFARVDAAVSVAHAFTTHAEAAETDYFTAVDTLKGPEDDAGAGLINDTELTSGVFYTYAVIDMNQLRANLGEQADIAERLARNLVETMATVSPGAKRGSTAPFAYAEFVLLERGTAQPRTLANAFLDPVATAGTHVMAASVERLLDYRSRIAQMYDATIEREAVATIHPVPQSSGLSPVRLQDALAVTFGVEALQYA